MKSNIKIKFNIKFFHYLFGFLITLIIFFLYLIENEIMIIFGIFPWLIIEVIWFFILKLDTELDLKSLNLLFSSLFLFTVILPLLELLFFNSNFFSINKEIVYLMQNEVAFFILYILLVIFFVLYFIITLIHFLNLNNSEKLLEVKSSVKEEKNTLKDEKSSIDNKEQILEKKVPDSINDNFRLNLPEINIKPFIQDDIIQHDKKEINIEIYDTENYSDNYNSSDNFNTENTNKIYEINRNFENVQNENVESNQLKVDEINNDFSEDINKENKNLEDEFVDLDLLLANESEKYKDKQITSNKITELEKNNLSDKNYENNSGFVNSADIIDKLVPESPHPHFDKDTEDDDIIEEKGAIILKTLKDFGIESKLLNYVKGPVVTRFEIEVDERVNLGKIINLEKNITYNLSAEKIRILAPIPGKKAVGIEIPNVIKQIVYFTELAKSNEFKNSNMNLPFILGKDIEGRVIVTDISKSPHLLIAGRTGSGKSVCINTLIASLVIANPPEKVRLILIDPKRVELSLYNDLPHLLTDEIIIFPEDASSALKWLVSEMENRYSILKENGFRSIEDYNQQRDEKLPYLVLIIDEFYALMQTSQKIIEDSLIHLSAMARAVGIHLIFATQRPSAEVVTGVIKSNLPSRIAFQTFSKTDSRIILDTNGAESLLGNGDLLFSFAGLPPIRIQGAFISTNEVRNLVQKVSTIYKTERKSINDLFSEIKKEDESLEEDFQGDDPLYPQAIEIVKSERKVSTSYIQRRLKIGYNRAARIVEQMEEEGLISPLLDGKKREIYI